MEEDRVVKSADGRTDVISFDINRHRRLCLFWEWLYGPVPHKAEAALIELEESEAKS